MKGYADLGDLPEDERIKLIAATAAHGHIVGVVVDDNEAADRYLVKLVAAGVRIVSRGTGPVANTILIRVGPRES